MVLTENMVVADRYRLSRMIGRGGMGSVWQAQHLGLDAPCAIKFIEGELANVAEAHARFEREAKAAAALRSPHVVQIFDHGVWQGMPYIAMELLDGQDLGKRLASQGGRLAPSEVSTIIQQVCKALTKAHATGVVHRDLKPDNIFLVNDDDGRPITKILDFGVAKSTSQAIDGSNTKTGAMLGTPYYMSPEQAQGIKTVDSRSDLWSLAVIVFQCLTGRLPFESEALGDLLVKIIVNPIPRPSDYYPNVPAGFDAWWVKAADRNPDNRFQTAKLFSESLQMALGQSSITDVSIDRGKLQKLGGATAVLPSSTSPAAHTAAFATPNPAMQSGGHLPIPTPQGMSAVPTSPSPGFSTGNPVAATFSGIDQPVAAPKKGPPIAVIGAAIGGFALVGLVLIGVTLFGGKKAAAGDGADPPVASASVTAAPSETTPPAEPPATATAAAEPTATAEPPASASAEPPEPPEAKVAATSRPVTKPTSKPADKPPATKPTATAASTGGTKPSTKKPADLGF